MPNYHVKQGSTKTRNKRARVSLAGIGGSSLSVDYVERKELNITVPYSDTCTSLLSIDEPHTAVLDSNEIRNASLIAVSNVGAQTAVIGITVPDWTLGTDAKDAYGTAASNIQWLLRPGASMILPGIQAVCTSAVSTNAANGMIEYGYDNAAKSSTDAEKPMQFHPIDLMTSGGKVATNTVQNRTVTTVVQTDERGAFNYDDVTPAGSLIDRSPGTGKSGLFGHGEIAGSTSTAAHYVPGSICVRFMDPGYTKFGLTKQRTTSKSGLVANTKYRFTMAIDGNTSSTEVLFTTDTTDTTWGSGARGTSVLGKINAALTDLAPWKDKNGVIMDTPQFSLESDGDIYLRWNSSKKTGISTNQTTMTCGAGSTAGYTNLFGQGLVPSSGTVEGNFQAPLFKELERTSEMMFDDGQGNLLLGGRKVGEVEYSSGILSFIGAPPFSSFEYTATFDSALGGTAYTDSNQGTRRNNVLKEVYASSTNIMRDAKLKVVALTI